MSENPLINEEERSLFREAVKNVTPLAKKNKVLPHQQRRRLSKIVIRPQNQNVLEKPTLLNSSSVDAVDSEAFLLFARTGLQNRVIQRLKRGEFDIQAVLDLHGFNLTTAEEAVYQFLNYAVTKHWRCVKIIHGKGARTGQHAPLLKNGINRWLRAYSNVLAFCSAKANDGGAGAVYVLLQNRH